MFIIYYVWQYLAWWFLQSWCCFANIQKRFIMIFWQVLITILLPMKQCLEKRFQSWKRWSAMKKASATEWNMISQLNYGIYCYYLQRRQKSCNKERQNVGYCMNMQRILIRKTLWCSTNFGFNCFLYDVNIMRFVSEKALSTSHQIYCRNIALYLYKCIM